MLRICTLFALAMALIGSQAAVAQDAIEEIVVTAQKREQNILDVPVAVSAISGEALEAAQVEEFSELTRVSPSLTMSDNGNQNERVITIRGVGTFSFSTAIEPTVSVVVDDVALLRSGQAFGQLADIERVEILRGPQGTLFGRNASAGVINIVTSRPSDELSGYVDGTFTDDNETRFAGMLSGPLGEHSGFRLNAFYYDRDGYISNLENGTTLNANESYGFRGKYRYESGPLDLTLIADYSESESNGPALLLRDVLEGSTPANGGPPYDIDGIGVNPGPGNTNVRINDDPVSDTDSLLFAARLNYDLGFATLTSVTSYQEWNYYWEVDVDDTASPTLFQYGPYDSNQFAQEFRLTSPGGEAFEYQFGLYYADGETDRQFTRDAPPFLAFLQQNWDSTATTESLAAFTQLSYSFSDATKLTGGLRINREEIGVWFSDGRSDPAAVYSGDDSETAVTGKLSLQHDIGESAMIFGTVATGYKGQGYDISSGFDQARADTPVRSESSINYEAGLKGQTSGGLAAYSAVVFLTDYDDFQAQGISDPEAAVPDFALLNVGKLRTKGIELEGVIYPADGLSFSGSAAFIDATVEEFPDAPCYSGQTEAEGCVNGAQDLAGQDLANSPDLKFNVAMSYERPVFSDFDGFLNVNYVWQDDVNYDLSNSPNSIQEAFGIANVNFGIRNETFQITAFVNNLFDEAYSSSIRRETAEVSFQNVPRDYTRYFGIRLKAGF